MTGQHPAPGHDEITVSAPATGSLCTSLHYYREGRPAHAIVTFGELGTRYPDALWPDCWYHTYPMCAACWQTTRHIATQCRPGLVIRDTTSLPARLPLDQGYKAHIKASATHAAHAGPGRLGSLKRTAGGMGTPRPAAGFVGAWA